jgi:hypothetical protein
MGPKLTPFACGMGAGRNSAFSFVVHHIREE